MNANNNTGYDANGSEKNGVLWFFLVLFFLISIVEGFMLIYAYGNKNSSNDKKLTNSTIQNTNDLKPTNTPTPIPTITPTPYSKIEILNKEYEFPIRGPEGQELNKFKYLIVQYEFTKELTVDFQKVKLANNRIILSFKLDITNNSDLPVQIITRDYVRLNIDDNDKWLAPDLHGDPVEVRPHSTKETNVGFAINESDNNIKLQVGELNGEKDIIEIN